MMKKLFSVIVSVVIGLTSYSQCDITAFSSQTVLDCGDSLFINFTAYGSLALSDTFGTGGPSDTSWAFTAGAQYDNPYIPSPTNDTYFWMGASPITPTALITTSYDVSGGGQICFDFVYAGQGGASPIEQPDQYDEGMGLQYNTGAGWIDIIYYPPIGGTLPANPGVAAPNVGGVGPYEQWTSVCVDIPPGAMTTSTSFQWVQEYNTGTTGCCDNWGLDNIVISTANPLYTINSVESGTDLGPAPVIYGALPTTDTTFNFFYTAGLADTCYTDYSIIMNATDLGPDLILDCNTNIVQLQASGVSVNDNFTWSPTSYLSNPTLVNPYASPIDTTDYIFTSSCGIDTVTVNVIANYLFGISGDTTICVGDSAQLEVYGGAQTYTWTPNNGTISDATIANPIVSPINTTNYVVVTDSAGCIKTDTFTVTVSNKNFPLVLITDADCAGSNSGSLVAVGSGALGPFEYYIDNGFTTDTSTVPTFNSLFSGTYTITYSDTMYCDIDTTITLAGGVSASIDTILFTDPLCVGATNGSIEVFIDSSSIDSNSIVNYSLNGGLVQTSPIFSNLSDGSYLVSAQVGSCPADTQTVILSAPATVEISFVDSTDLTCGGSGDGEIQVSANNGVMPFQYSIDNINFYSNGGVFDSLAAGNYSVYVLDANGCGDSLATSIAEPLPVTITNVVNVNPLCFNDSTGSITFDAINGLSPYTYSIDSGVTPFVNTNSFTSLGDGSYILIAQDANGCISNVVFDTLVEPAQLVLVEDSTQNSTCGVADGIVYVSESNGSPNISFNIDGGIFQPSGTFNGLAAGIHTVMVQDMVNGCIDSLNIILTDDGAPTLSIVSADSVTCFGLNDATVQLSAVGGATPYQFSLNASPSSPDSLFLNVAGGLQSFIVEDAIGCISSVDTIIYEPTVLNITATQDSVSCDEYGDGEIHLTATGGSPTYTYALNSIGVTQSSPDFLNLAASSNLAYVIDVNGCTDSVVQVVLQPDTLEITTIALDISCNALGSITVNPTGGTLPYTYSITGGLVPTNNVFTIPTGGTYTVSVTDANGCGPATAVDNIIAPTPIVYNVDSITSNLMCNGNTDGFIGIAANGGSGPYTYSINGGAFQTDSFFNNLSVGTYSINVQDVFGCTSIATNHVIAEPSLLSVSLNSTTVSCFGLADGTIIINNVAGGVGPYNVTVDGVTYPYVAGLVVNNLNAGTYNVFVEDVNLCNTTMSITIADVTAVNLTLGGVSNASCYGELDGEIEVSVSGGTPIYTFELFTASTTTTISNNSSAVFTGLAGTETGLTYPILVTDANGCKDSLSHTITQPANLIIDSLSTVDETCFGYYNGYIVTHVSGGSSPYTYSWAPTGHTNSVADGLTSGVHTVTVTDANGCSVTSSGTLASIDPILADINPDSASISMGDTLQLGVTVQNAIGTNLQYSWSPTAGLSCTDCANPSVTVYNDISYSVVVTDENGCMSYNQTEVFIGVDASLFFFIPNGFSPNGDGINDNFQVYGQDVKSVDMIVFNRWGEKVFEGNNQFQPWDGTFKGVLQNPGVFTYKIDVTFLNDAEVQKKGSVTMVR